MVKIQSTSTFILFAIFAILIIVFAPFAIIWAINTLFPGVAIPYTLETWMASVIIGSVFGVGKVKTN